MAWPSSRIGERELDRMIDALSAAARRRDGRGRADEDAVQPPGAGWLPPARRADGSDADRIGAWPEKRIFDTQLGPNRNGRKW